TAAIDHTFEYVRTTTSARDSSTRSIALHGANSPYASSTTSNAPCSSTLATSRSIVPRASTVPVGLFGEHTNTIEGSVSAMSAAQLGRASVGIAVQADLAHGVEPTFHECRRRRIRALVGVEPHVDVDLRRVIAREVPQVVARRRPGRVGRVARGHEGSCRKRI